MRGRYYLRSHPAVEGHAEADVTRREGRQSNPDLAKMRASVDRPLDHSQLLSMETSATGVNSSQETAAISGATGRPVNPPNLSLVVPAGRPSSTLVVSPEKPIFSLGDRPKEYDVGLHSSSQNAFLTPTSRLL